MSTNTGQIAIPSGHYQEGRQTDPSQISNIVLQEQNPSNMEDNKESAALLHQMPDHDASFLSDSSPFSVSLSPMDSEPSSFYEVKEYITTSVIDGLNDC